jgi:hypothetical protein
MRYSSTARELFIGLSPDPIRLTFVGNTAEIAVLGSSTRPGLSRTLVDPMETQYRSAPVHGRLAAAADRLGVASKP